MAYTKARKKRSTTRHKGRKVVIVAKTAHRRRRVAGTSVGATHHRKRRKSGGGMMGSTSSTLKNIGMFAVGMAGGALGTAFLLRPLEHKLATQFPMVAKFMGGAEILIGGYMAMRMKTPILKGVGLGVMAGGIKTVMDQLHIGAPSPAALHGMDDYTTVRVPINGSYTNLIAGVINDSERIVNTSLVAGVSGSDAYRNYILNGSVGKEDEDYLPPMGYNY